MRQDDILIFENYFKLQQLNEAGVIKAKLKGMKNWDSLKNRIKSYTAKKSAGLAKAIGAKQTSKALTKDAISARRVARNASKDAKIKSILTSHESQIEKLAKEIVNDLNKLRLNRTGLTDERVKQHMISIIKDDLETQLSTYKKPKVNNEEPEDIDYSDLDTGGSEPINPDIDSSSNDEEPEDIDYSEDFGEDDPNLSPKDDDYEDFAEKPIEDTNTNEYGAAANGAYVDSGEYAYKKENGRWYQYYKSGTVDSRGKRRLKDTPKGIASNTIKNDLEKIWIKQGRKIKK